MKDIIIQDGDIKIEKGDFLVDESQAQHIEHLLLATPGTYKQTPSIGIGIRRALNSPLRPELRRRIRLGLQADNIRIRKVIFDGDKITIK